MTAGSGAHAYERRPSVTGPRGDLLTGQMREYGRDPLATMRRWRDDHGDLVPIRFGPFRAHMAFGPAEVEELFIERAADYRKSIGTRMLIPLLGHGLLTAEGEAWRTQRRLAAPAFHRERIAGYAETMTRYAAEATDDLRDGQPVDVHRAMTALTLRIVARVLFDADVTARIEDVARLGTEVQDFYYDRFASLRFLVPTWLPTPGNLRLRRAIRRLDEIVYGILDERRGGADRGDLLSILRDARDGDRPLSDRQVRDEVMTLLLAGHETTALALTWAWLLLDRSPAARERLEGELDTVLDGRLPTVDDVGRLPFTGAVVNEVLRLYPAAYVTGREALRETSLGGVRLPKRHVVLTAMAVIHRDPRFFPDPDAFRPERWLDGLERRLPRGAFIPFGLGGRKCIGASFAMLEATLVLATIARRVRLEVAPGDVGVQPAITLRPRGPVPAVAHVRRA
ncbi:MAG TPA: cytochrome P450 [Candidatus Limnocylindrales bacterium]|nr:cytochrome P450 [Candidatus Limnocylindrales bacterium]